MTTRRNRSNPVEELKDYYRRAPEYENLYQTRSARRELDELTEPMNGALRDRRMLEVACGTGFWTARAARVARHIVATDASSEMLAVARVFTHDSNRERSYLCWTESTWEMGTS